jgi:hypothetical protein
MYWFHSELLRSSNVLFIEKDNLKICLKYCFVLIASLLCFQIAFAQKRIIQFSGLVVGGDSAYGIPGVHVFVPKAGRGTVTSHLGYFSLPTVVGDSVVIRSIGYKEKYFVIPQDEKDNISVIVEMFQDTTMIEVEIFPWPTERIFKEAFLALKLPEQDMDNMHKNLNEQVLKRMLYNQAPDAMVTHRYYMEQQVRATEKRFLYNAYAWQNLANPFAWASFIKSVKEGGLKRKDAEEYSEDSK